MPDGQQILIVSSNRLVGIGLKKLLLEYFAPQSVTVVRDASEMPDPRMFTAIFLSSETYVLHRELFPAIGPVVVVLTERAQTGHASEIPVTINVTESESGIVEQLQHALAPRRTTKSYGKTERLSAREIAVLRLVARGQINKQIADRLSISLHTVISHRKNITRKLGIKTVSGLTIYALLNGLISTKDAG